MRYMYCFLLWGLAVTGASCQQKDCDLSALFSDAFVTDWKADSLGKSKARLEYCKKIFLDQKGLNKEGLPLTGISDACLLFYLGRPNKIEKSKAELTFVYFVSMSWIGEGGKEVEGILLLFKIDKKRHLIAGYSVIIT